MIYIIKTDSDPSFFKIGYSRHSPISRVQTLQTGCPFKLCVAKIIIGSKVTEGLLHRKLLKHHHRGEWFVGGAEFEADLLTIIEGFRLKEVPFIENFPRKRPEVRAHCPVSSLNSKIIELYNKGFKVREVAEALGVHRTTVMRHTKTAQIITKT